MDNSRNQSQSPNSRQAESPVANREDFATTQWTLVLAAIQGGSAAAGAALEQLCQRYWFPIYSFVRRRGSSPHEAEDLTQSFFAFILEKEALKKIDRQKGKFRNFLLASLANFLNNEWDRLQTLKRGGGFQFINWDEAMAEARYGVEPVENLTPERLFEKRWARTLIEQVLNQLKLAYARAGKEILFNKLEPGLTGELSPGELAKWAAELEMTEGAVKVAVHRLRRRFGEMLRNEIAATVSSAAEVDEEIRCLFAAIGD
jgi:RNA polymerase sigma factor (sigma-70 family)